jgi:hypothetical protein
MLAGNDSDRTEGVTILCYMPISKLRARRIVDNWTIKFTKRVNNLRAYSTIDDDRIE